MAPMDFHLISITPTPFSAASCMERLVVRQFLYPAFLSSSPESLVFSDQFAFRPTGSTTSALVWFLHTITQLLTQHDYVIVLALDTSKATDTVRHLTFLDKLARLDLPYHVYNWLVHFFNGHSHCTRFERKMSSFTDISASIIQGSAIGTASYVVHVSDLVSKTTGNMLCKYADDTYLIIPASNHRSRIAELDHIHSWANHNNLRLIRAKCVELI